MNKMKRQPTGWEKIFADDVTDKGLSSQIYEEHMQLSIKKQTTGLKYGQRIWINIFLKKISRWPTDTGKDVQCR